jgi:signal transduction histidine kinase
MRKTSMVLYDYINSILNKIEFNNKTKLLIAIIASGMITMGFLMLISIFALKFDYETLFQKRTIPQVELEGIKDIYSVNIYDTLIDLQQGEINLKNASEVIVLAKQIIETQWHNYENSINYTVGGLPEFASNWLNFFLLSEKLPEKNIFQKGLVTKIQDKMANIDLKTKNIMSLLAKGKTKEANVIITRILLEINSINISFSSLINSHLKDAIAEKHRNDRIFETSIFMLVLLLGFVFFLSIIISFIIINHFKELHNSLEEKVDLKTHELQILNSSLEQRIKKEVENSRKKDQIMFQQARLASLGEMLQNIAHQWRQPLGALMMIVQSFQSKFLSGKLNEEFIESRVEDAQLLAQSMSDTLEDFRTFFNPNKAHKKFTLKKVIEKSLELSKYQIENEALEIYFTMTEDVEVYGFENELTHVLLNLLNNAKDALCEKKIENKKIWIIVKKTKMNVLINIIDNAGGIKNDIMTKVFDPYFTTKHQSVGTGIGLYMSKQIVEKHMNGKIWCKNIKHRLGESEQLFDCAMFTIEIPLILNIET